MAKRSSEKRQDQRGKLNCEAMEPRTFLDGGIGHEAWSLAGADGGSEQPVLYRALDGLPPEASQSGMPNVFRRGGGKPISEALRLRHGALPTGGLKGVDAGEILKNLGKGRGQWKTIGGDKGGWRRLAQRLGNVNNGDGGGLKRIDPAGGLYLPGTDLGPTTPEDAARSSMPVAAASYDAKGGTAMSARSQSGPGADRGDIVEADDRYLYILSRQELVIADTQGPGGALAESSRVPIEGWPIAEYLRDGKLTVISGVTTPGQAPDTPVPLELAATDGKRMASDATSLMLPWGNQQVKVTEYDVSDRSKPKVVKETYLDGNYVDSHTVGSKTYVVTQENPPITAYRGDPLAASARGDDAGNTAAARPLKARAGYATLGTKAGISAQPKRQFASTSYVGGDAEPATLEGAPATDLMLAPEPGKLTISVFDSANPGAGVVGKATVEGTFGATVYGTDDRLYLLSTDYQGEQATTKIRSFALQGNNVVAESTGEVPGRVIGTSGVSASGGRLRVVTTNDRWDESGNKSTSGLYVLERAGDKLNVAGKVEGLAAGESIGSAQFAGDDAFLSASGQGGASLISVDLADPKAPKVAGESAASASWTNLQAVDGTHLVAVGRGVDPSNGTTQGLKVALLDISDPSRPVEVDAQQIGPQDFNQGSAWSEAEYDARALGNFDDGVVTLPVSTSVAGADGDGDGFPDTWTSKNDLYVFKVDAAQGLSEVGAVGHPTNITRSAEVGNVLYSVGDTTVKANKLDGKLTDAGSLKIQDEYAPIEPIGDVITLPAQDGGPTTLPAEVHDAVTLPAKAAYGNARGNGGGNAANADQVPATFRKTFDAGSSVKVRRFRLR